MRTSNFRRGFIRSLAALVAAASVATASSAIAVTPETNKFFGTFENRGNCGVSILGSRVGHQPNMCQVFASWYGQRSFPTNIAVAAHERGVSFMVTWQPWNSRKGKAPQKAFALNYIAKGKYDAYIGLWAKQIKLFKYPVYIRFAHEMNGPWYPWGASDAKKSAKLYVAAWRHVHDIFVQAGATNAMWVWAPNAVKSGSQLPLKPFYPGDAYVDYVGPVGYARHNGDTFKKVFAATFAQISKFTAKPAFVSETGVLNAVKKPEQFVSSFFAEVKARKINGFVWFNSTLRRSPWNLNSKKALSKFKTGLASWLTAP